MNADLVAFIKGEMAVAAWPMDEAAMTEGVVLL